MKHSMVREFLGSRFQVINGLNFQPLDLLSILTPALFALRYNRHRSMGYLGLFLRNVAVRQLGYFSGRC